MGRSTKHHGPGTPWRGTALRSDIMQPMGRHCMWDGRGQTVSGARKNKRKAILMVEVWRSASSRCPNSYEKGPGREFVGVAVPQKHPPVVGSQAPPDGRATWGAMGLGDLVQAEASQTLPVSGWPSNAIPLKAPGCISQA
jgi:hypothetical protein